ncbi:hypothetical protein GCM10022245_59290 [Streptomyces mayteni]
MGAFGVAAAARAGAAEDERDARVAVGERQVDPERHLHAVATGIARDAGVGGGGRRVGQPVAQPGGDGERAVAVEWRGRLGRHAGAPVLARARPRWARATPRRTA